MRGLAAVVLWGSSGVAAAYYAPLDATRTDGADARLVVTTPHLGAGQGNCSIYPYNYYGACEHPAWDIGSLNGGAFINAQPVRSVEAGTVLAVNPDSYCGLDVFVDHHNGVVTRYCHLSAFGDVWVGKAVAARETVGFVGSTGAEAPHLHFEARQGGAYGAYLNLGNPLDWPRDVVVDNTPPPPDACAALGYAGVCEGALLRWCQNGVVQAFDCARSGMVCGWENDTTGNNCLNTPPPPVEPPPPPPPPVEDECARLGFAGECEGALLRWCEGGTVRTYDCASIGRACGWENDTTGNNCLTAATPPPPPPPVDACEALGYAGRCDGSTLVWCEAGSVQSYNCANAGMACGWQDDTVGNNCRALGNTFAPVEEEPPSSPESEPKPEAEPRAAGKPVPPSEDAPPADRTAQDDEATVGCAQSSPASLGMLVLLLCAARPTRRRQDNAGPSTL